MMTSAAARKSSMPSVPPGRREPPQADRSLLDRPLLCSILVSIALLALVFLFFVPRYENSDDVMMNLIVAGRLFLDRPDEHLMYSNVLIGLSLKRLYELGPDFPWYGIYLYVSLALAIGGICYAFFLRAGDSSRRWLLACLFLAAFALPAVVTVQFTRVSGFAALAGLLLLITAERGRHLGIQIGVAAFFLLLSCLVRIQGCLLVVVVLAPALAWFMLSPGGLRVRTTCVLVLAGALALAYGLERFNGWYYAHSNGWQNFYEFNTLRARFTDYRQVNYTSRGQAAVEEVGWSKNDLRMLVQWNYADPVRFSADKLRRVLDSVETSDRARIGRTWEDFKEDRPADLNFVLATLAASSVLVGGSRRGWIVPLLSLLTALAVAIVLFQYFRLPPRVYQPLFASVLAVGTVHASGSLIPRGGWWRKTAGLLRGAALLVLAWLLLGRTVALFLINARDLARHEEARDFLTALAPRESELYIDWTAMLPYEYLVYPLERFRLPRAFHVVVLLTANPRVSFTAERFRKFGITDLYQALYQRSDIFLFSRPELNETLGIYMEEHYGIHVDGRIRLCHPTLNAACCYQVFAQQPGQSRP
jgi:hypothetical protein